MRPYTPGWTTLTETPTARAGDTRAEATAEGDGGGERRLRQSPGMVSCFLFMVVLSASNAGARTLADLGYVATGNGRAGLNRPPRPGPP